MKILICYFFFKDLIKSHILKREMKKQRGRLRCRSHATWCMQPINMEIRWKHSSALGTEFNGMTACVLGTEPSFVTWCPKTSNVLFIILISQYLRNKYVGIDVFYPSARCIFSVSTILFYLIKSHMPSLQVKTMHPLMVRISVPTA